MINLPYSLQVIQPLKELFLQDNFQAIPDIKLKPNTDISLITSNVASLAISTSPNTDFSTQVSDIFDSIAEYFQDGRNLLRLQTIEYTSKAFAEILEMSYSILNDTIAPTVDLIRKDIEERYITLMTREKAEGLITSVVVEPHENDYTFVNWGELSSPVLQNEIIDNACFNANIASPSLSPLCLAYIARKANFVADFKQIVIPEAVSATIIEKLKTIVSNIDGVHEDVVNLAWSIFTNKFEYDNFCRRIGDKFLRTRDMVSNCTELMATVKSITAMITPVKNVASEDLAVNTLEDLVSNITVVSKTIYAIQYWLLIAKELKYKNKLILSPNTINGETYQDFVSEGKSIADIHNYLKAFHLDTTLPLDGISIDTVKNANVEERLEKSSSKLRSNAVFITSKCLIGAYEYGVTKFIRNGAMTEIFPHSDEPLFISRFVKRAMERASFLGGKVANLDKVLYDLIIGEFYKDSLISSMYKYLGTGFDNLIDNEATDITDDRIVENQCDSVIDLLVDYLFTQIVEPSNK